MPFSLPKRVLSNKDCCCCRPYIIGQMLGINPDTPPPVLSDWCVQWVLTPYDAVLPCGSDPVDMNGETNVTTICTGDFAITDFNGNANHSFYYKAIATNGVDSCWYVQVIRPSGDPALITLGSYSGEFSGFPYGPIDIIPTDSNCVLRTFRAVFTVTDASIDCFSGITFEPYDIDLAPTYPFTNPSINSELLNQIGQGRLGPQGSVDVQVVGNQITITIQSLVGITKGRWDRPAGPPEVEFTFTEI